MALECQQETQEPEGAIDLWRPASAQANGLALRSRRRAAAGPGAAHLVGNAIKFTYAGEGRMAAGAANGHLSRGVSDTGPGIPPEECEHIFEKFRQVDSSNTRAKGGTGLGLAIAREIVEMHGGRIWVESTLGQGSTFRMGLPVCAPVAAGAV